jgi:YVTN family beta-propeller protein
LSLLFALSACHWHINDVSTDPSASKLDFPAGLVLDPGGRFLYVSNGNADLRFGGGTIQMLDLARFDCALENFAGRGGSADCAVFPSDDDVRLSRDKNGLPVGGCVLDPIDQQVTDCVEDPFILENATVRVGNFAGTMRIKVDGDPSTSQQRNLYVAVRGDPSVTFIDVDLSKVAPTPDPWNHFDVPGVLDCFDDPSMLLTRSDYDPTTNHTEVPPRCDDSHLVQTYTCPDALSCVQGDNDIPPEPFNMLLDEGQSPSGATYSRLLVAHLAAGRVTIVNLLGTPSVGDVSPPFFIANQSGRFGAFGLARRDDPTQPLYYLTSNLNAAISTFYIDETDNGGMIQPGAVFSTTGSFSIGSDGRELLFQPDGQRAFMSQNAPPSVAVLDTRLDQPGGRGLPLNKIVDLVQVCQGPSHMAVRQQPVAGPPGAMASLQTKLYVACFTSNQVMVVDPDSARVDETILTGRGPTEITFNFTGDETPAAQRIPEPAHRRAYVTLYSESTIGVIDLDPGSPTENRMIGRIGLPLPPPSTP